MKNLLLAFSLIASLLSLNALADPPDWNPTQTITILHSKIKIAYNDAKGGTIAKGKDIEGQMSAVRRNAQGDVIDVYSFKYYRRDGQKIWAGTYDTTSSFAVANPENKSTIAFIWGLPYLVKMKDGRIKGGKGNFAATEITHDDGGAIELLKYSLKTEKGLLKDMSFWNKTQATRRPFLRPLNS